MDSNRVEHLRGILVTVTAVLILSPDALLVRLIQTDPWTLIFWRGLLSGGTIFAFLAIGMRGTFWSCLFAIGRPGLLASVLQGIGGIFFISALRLTSVANTLVILAATPLFAAVFSTFFLQEQVSRRTWVAVLVAMLGILVLFSGSFGGGSVLGDLCALAAACLWAANLVIIRRAKRVNMVPSAGLGGFLSALLVWLGGVHPLAVATGDWGYLLLLGLLVLPLSFALITLGPRRLSAPEVSLILMLETPLGSFWVWWLLGEHPSAATLLGGGLILGTLLVHTLASLRSARLPAHLAV